MKKALFYSTIPLLFSMSLTGCFTGSLGFSEGGRTTGSRIEPSATFTRGATYKIICPDQEELKRREKLVDEGEDISNLPPATLLVDPENYDGKSCKYEGMSSVFFLFNFVPVTPPLNPSYAISTAVQKVEGDTMIHMHSWNEIHYYGILGRVAVFKVRGDIVRFESPGK